MKTLVEAVGITLCLDSIRGIGCGVLSMKTLQDITNAIS